MPNRRCTLDQEGPTGTVYSITCQLSGLGTAKNFGNGGAGDLIDSRSQAILRGAARADRQI